VRIKLVLLYVFLMILVISTFPVSISTALTKTTYVHGSISEKSGRVIHLLGGSIWLLSRDSFVFPFTDVLIVMTGNQQGIFFHGGDEIAAKLIDGNPIRESGYYGTVIEQLGEGAILKLDDGSLWSIPSYDRYDTGWWLPPYKIIVSGNLLFMFNLDKGKKIWASLIKGFNPSSSSKGIIPSSPRERQLDLEKRSRERKLDLERQSRERILDLEKRSRERKLALKKQYFLVLCNIYRKYKGRLSVESIVKRCQKRKMSESQCRKCLE